MKEKLMLIAGCSHTAGSEIDGTEDSKYNRQHSYGGVLADIMGYKPVNIAEPGSCNQTIARAILEWFNTQYNSNSMDVFVMVGWTESTRMEVPWHRESWYEEHNPYHDWYAQSGRWYMRVNSGWPGGDPEEMKVIPEYQKFMALNQEYLEISCANLVLQLEYFFKFNNINYVMCNTMPMFGQSRQVQFYVNLIDSSRYLHLRDSDRAFFWWYRNQGYENPKAKYWHHDEVPHKLFAEELYNFIKGKY